MRKSYFLEFRMALSLFTTFPVGRDLKWEPDAMKRLPEYLPFVGFGIGLFAGLIYMGLEVLPVSSFLKAVLLTASFLFMTGGFHMDGLMDTCDGHFSRRDLPRRLEIMKDSRVGAFAVMGFTLLMLVKVGLVMELFIQEVSIWGWVFIPVYSRILLRLLLKKAPYAKDEGLGKMYGGYNETWDIGALLIYLSILVLAGFMQIHLMWVGLVLFLFLLVYKKWAIQNFGGITGDLLGGFLELCELTALGVWVIGGFI